MAVFLKIFGTFSVITSESKTEAMSMPIPRVPATQIVFNAMGQQYRQTAFFTFLGVAVPVTPSPIWRDDIDQRKRAG